MVILRVSPNSEFRVRDDLHQLGLSALVPVEFKLIRKWVTVWVMRNGVEIAEKQQRFLKQPVIRGYVFAGLDVCDWASVTAIREVKGALWIDGRPARLTGTQTAALELLSRPANRSNASGWSPGDITRVRKGAWTEFEAVVQSIKKGKIVAIVNLFGRPNEVTLSPDQLEPA